VQNGGQRERRGWCYQIRKIILGALIQKHCIFELDKNVECRSGRLHTLKVEKIGKKKDFNFIKWIKNV